MGEVMSYALAIALPPFGVIVASLLLARLGRLDSGRLPAVKSSPTYWRQEGRAAGAVDEWTSRQPVDPWISDQAAP